MLNRVIEVGITRSLNRDVSQYGLKRGNEDDTQLEFCYSLTLHIIASTGLILSLSRHFYNMIFSYTQSLLKPIRKLAQSNGQWIIPLEQVV